MTPYIAIPHRTSQRAHTAAGHVARVKSAATGYSTPQAIRAAIVACDRVIEETRALKGELKLALKASRK